MIIYNFNEAGKACNFQPATICPEGWESIDSDVIPSDITQYDKESYKKVSLHASFINERNARILEADKWELPSVQKRYNITQEQVENYKQFLLDMDTTLTIESTVEELENPPWPPKLIEGILT
jgi:hypothetical protein